MEVDLEFGHWLDPHPPVDELKEGGLEEVELLKAHTADVGYEVVAVEDVVVEFGGDEDRCEDQSI